MAARGWRGRRSRPSVRAPRARSRRRARATPTPSSVQVSGYPRKSRVVRVGSTAPRSTPQWRFRREQAAAEKSTPNARRAAPSTAGPRSLSRRRSRGSCARQTGALRARALVTLRILWNDPNHSPDTGDQRKVQPAFDPASPAGRSSCSPRPVPAAEVASCGADSETASASPIRPPAVQRPAHPTSVGAKEPPGPSSSAAMLDCEKLVTRTAAARRGDRAAQKTPRRLRHHSTTAAITAIITRARKRRRLFGIEEQRVNAGKLGVETGGREDLGLRKRSLRA